jgi:hypothetical protein
MKRAILLISFFLASSAVCSAQQFTYYYPQVASGFTGAGAWQTTIFVTNATATTSATGTITLTRSDGAAFNLNWTDEDGAPVGTGNTISFTLGGAETRKFMSVVNTPLSTGFATVTSTAPVMGTAVFSQYDGVGRLTGEAGVPAAIPLGKQAILVDTTNNFKTGVAIANPNTNPLHITFQLMGENGQVVANATRDVPGLQHFSVFVHELFPGLPGMVGRLQFWCTNPMASVGLRFDGSFARFTTLPPLAVQ